MSCLHCFTRNSIDYCYFDLVAVRYEIKTSVQLFFKKIFFEQLYQPINLWKLKMSKAWLTFVALIFGHLCELCKCIILCITITIWSYESLFIWTVIINCWMRLTSTWFIFSSFATFSSNFRVLREFIPDVVIFIRFMHEHRSVHFNFISKIAGSVRLSCEQVETYLK